MNVLPPPPNYDGINQQNIYPPNPINQQIIIPQVIVVGPIAQQAYCPICKQQVQTKVTYVAGIQNWLSFILMMFFGIICDCVHQCSQCNNYIGTYKRLGN